MKRISFEHLAVGYQLLHLGYKDPLAEASRIALIFFVAMVQSAKFDVRVAARSVGRLREVLESTLSTAFTVSPWAGHERCMVWIAIMGGLTSREAEHTEWFAGVATEACKMAGIREWEELEWLMMALLFDNVLLGMPLRIFWEYRLVRGLSEENGRSGERTIRRIGKDWG